MDTTLPPIMCAACNEPIWPGAPLVWRTAHHEETEEVVQSVTYHEACAPPLEEA